MSEQAGGRQGFDIEQFEKLAARTRELFEQSVEKSRASLSAALDKAKQEMVAAGSVTAEKGEQLRSMVLRDLEATREELHSAVNKARQGFDPSRIGFGVLGLMQSFAESVSDAFSDMAETLQSKRTYKTGEICGPGTLTCDACGKTMSMAQTGHVPPCSGCKKTEFSRSY